MKSQTSLTGLAVGVVRAWTRLYTWRMPAGPREIRRAEIESDLWESQQDVGRHDLRSVLHVLGRLLIGVPDDLGWRMEHAPVLERRLEKTAVWTAAALCLAVWWMFASLQLTELPSPPAPARFVDLRLEPPPPPPPRPIR